MQNVDTRGITMCFVAGGLAAGTTSTISTTATIPFCINGKALSKTAITNGATPTTDVCTGSAFTPVKTNQGSIFVVGLDATGAQKVCQGRVQALDPASGLFITAPEFPLIPDTVCPIGYIVIKAGSTAAAGGWVFGTNNMASVTGVTYTFVDVMALPFRPQIA